MRALDTNVIVRLIHGDDPAQVATAERFVQNGAWISHVALAETTWVLSSVYDYDARQIATAVEMLLNHTEVTLQEPEIVQAALEQFRNRLAVGFSDCLLLEIARRAGHLPLGTFDRDLSKLDGAERLR